MCEDDVVGSSIVSMPAKLDYHSIKGYHSTETPNTSSQNAWKGNEETMFDYWTKSIVVTNKTKFSIHCTNRKWICYYGIRTLNSEIRRGVCVYIRLSRRSSGGIIFLVCLLEICAPYDMMASTGGLTKRKNVNNYQDITGGSSTSEVTDSRKYEEPHKNSDDEDDHESKEQKLTLMEEVLLLGLKDREVREPV